MLSIVTVSWGLDRNWDSTSVSFPVTSRTVLNLFAYLKLVVSLFEFICSCILVTNSIN